VQGKNLDWVVRIMLSCVPQNDLARVFLHLGSQGTSNVLLFKLFLHFD
jgi:hypothetical protein